MRSATDFLPWSITLLMKRAKTLELYLESGRICRLGAGPLTWHTLYLYFFFVRLAPYLERLCLRLATPEIVSSVPRMM